MTAIAIVSVINHYKFNWLDLFSDAQYEAAITAQKCFISSAYTRLEALRSDKSLRKQRILGKDKARKSSNGKD